MSPRPVQEFAAQFGAHVSLGGFVDSLSAPKEQTIGLAWAELDSLLPDGGLPHGVIELESPRLLGGATSIALAAVRAAQVANPKTWCAWIDPWGTLFAPGVVNAEVDLSRLFVIRPPKENLLRVALTTAKASAFRVIVIDLDELSANRAGVKGSAHATSVASKLDPFVRKLSLHAMESGATMILLTDAHVRRSAPLPTALRLEVVGQREGMGVRVAKDRYGRTGIRSTIPYETRPTGKLEV